jgi:cold shock CspA family protein
MRGKISQWKDDKGFGFILPDDGTEKLFFHISSVKTRGRRPQIGDTVLYESARDSQNRLKAKGVVIEGVIDQSALRGRSIICQTAPKKKNAFDYVLLIFLLGSLIGAGLILFQSGSIEKAIPFGVTAVVAVILLYRPRKPKEKTFSCAHCKKIVEHDARTIKAWNNGFLKLYCSSCHRQWLNENPIQTRSPALRRAGGCLGSSLLLAIIPIVVGVSLYFWFA